MPHINRNGAEIHYDCVGTGPAVLLLQGVGVPAGGWSPQIEPLSKHYRMIAPDNRGMGRSGLGEGPLTVETMAADARAILDAECIDQVHVVGHSMGGVLAQQLALDIPDRVRSLALLCTYVRAADAAQLTLWKLWIGLRCHLGTRPMRRRAFLEMVLPPGERSPAEKDALAARLQGVFGRDLAEQPSIVMRQVKAMSRHDISERLPEIKHIPSLVISAALDRMAPPQQGRALAEALGAEYEEWEGSAHGLPVLQAEALNPRLLGHLEAHR